ncbi:MAG: ATP-binding protein, partial [Bacteroidia bacterium]|nr:ATP-binding protein [Bacteroidia bacterium]
MENSIHIQKLEAAVRMALQRQFKKQETTIPPVTVPTGFADRLSKFVEQNHIDYSGYICLLLAFIPHLDPAFFTRILYDFLPNGGDFPEFGGVKGRNHRGILPTGETVLFVLAGADIGKRIEISKLFDESHC